LVATARRKGIGWGSRQYDSLTSLCFRRIIGPVSGAKPDTGPAPDAHRIFGRPDMPGFCSSLRQYSRVEFQPVFQVVEADGIVRRRRFVRHPVCPKNTLSILVSMMVTANSRVTRINRRTIDFYSGLLLNPAFKLGIGWTPLPSNQSRLRCRDNRHTIDSSLRVKLFATTVADAGLPGVLPHRN
jgi:hypothetical protein